MKTLRRIGAVLLVLGSPVLVVATMAIAPAVGLIWWPAWFLWELARHPRTKRNERRRIESQRRRVEELIQMHLIAHRLADTKENRWRVLQGLSTPQPRRRKA